MPPPPSAYPSIEQLEPLASPLEAAVLSSLVSRFQAVAQQARAEIAEARVAELEAAASTEAASEDCAAELDPAGAP